MKNDKINRWLALLGILSGPVLFAAEMLSVLFDGFSLSESGLWAWGRLSSWRITFSAVLGIVGTLLLLCGLWSGYRIVRAHCHHLKRSLYLFGIAGRGTGCLFHFMVFCLLPLSVRNLLYVGAKGEYAISFMKSSMLVIRLPMIICAVLLIAGAIFITLGLLHEDVHVSRNLAVMNAATLGVLGTILFLMTDKLSWRGVFLGLFNLGDSLQALAIFLYWNKKVKEAEKED